MTDLFLMFRNMAITNTKLFLVCILLAIAVRIIFSMFVARRGDIIADLKGIEPKEAKIFGLACFVTVFFGILPGYLVVILYANALPDRGGFEE